MSELAVILYMKSVGIICITESHLTEDIKDAEVSIPNFDLYREDRSPKSKSGGSAIYVRKDFNVTKLNWFIGTESIALKINAESFEIYVICIGLHP